MKQTVTAPDPFVLTSTISPITPFGAFNLNRDGRTVSTPRITPGETTGVFIIAGQSNAANYVDALYTPTNGSKIDCIDIFNGGTYRAADPQLSCDGAGGSMFFRCADKLISNGVFARIILVFASVGNTAVSDWATNKAIYERLTVASKRVQAVGLTPSAFLWMQGENDTAFSTTQSDYQTALSSIVSTVRTAGFTAPWLVGKCSYAHGSTSSAVRAAQAAVVNGTDIFAGADTDGLTSASRQADNLHFNATGADAAAALWATAIDAVF